MANPKVRVTKAQQRILDKYSDIVSKIKHPNYKPSYGKGSRSPTVWNQVQSNLTVRLNSYNMTKAEMKSARGLSRRLNNVMKMVKTDEKIRETMEYRWANSSSDLQERFGNKKFSELTQSDIEELVEIYVSESGLMQLPSLVNPNKKIGGGGSAWSWDS